MQGTMMTREQATTTLVAHNNKLRIEGWPSKFVGPQAEREMHIAVSADLAFYGRLSDLELFALAGAVEVTHAS